MNRRTTSCLGVVLAFVLAMPLWADSDVRIVRLSFVDGPVQLDRNTGEGFDRAIMNMPITNGMRLWTRDDSRAEVEFEEGTTLRLTPGTKVDFTRLVLTDDGKRSTVVTIESGEAYVKYQRKNGEDFRIRAGDREIDLTKKVELRIAVDPDRAEIAVLNGELFADGNKIKKKHTAVLNFASGQYQVAEGIAPGSEDAWNHERAEYVDNYMRASYNGSGFYGSSMLNSYGSWYGNCWQPYGMTAAWSPYSSGAWVWYPGFGYSWVSPYPWGWQTFRSGAWIRDGGGWCWTPNRRYYGLGWAPVYRSSGVVNPQPPAPPVKPGPATGPVPPANPYRPDPRLRGPHSMILVGDINEQEWRLRRHDEMQPLRGDHDRPASGFAGANRSTTVGPNSAVTSAGRTETPHNRHAEVPANTERVNRAQWQREHRGGERPSPPRIHEPAPRTSSPAPRAESPRMTSHPPRAESPRMSAPSPRMESPRMSAPRAESPRQTSTPHTVNPK